jgi:hypothetical protein
MTLPMPRWPLLTLALMALCAAVLFTGCATTEGTPVVTQLSPDTYMITIRARSSYFAMDKPKFTSQAVNHSLDYAASKGKVAVPITLRENTAGMFEDWVNVEYEFRLVDKNDPRANRNKSDADQKPAPAKQPEPVKQPAPIKPPEPVTKTDTRTKQDVYNDLLKLDDLRKKGIITQEEFEIEKKKLLAK